jgi:hypothetical protein
MAHLFSCGRHGDGKYEPSCQYCLRAKDAYWAAQRPVTKKSEPVKNPPAPSTVLPQNPKLSPAVRDDITSNRHGGHRNSVKANALVTPRKNSQKWDICQWLADRDSTGGGTANQYFNSGRAGYKGATARFSELKLNHLFIYETGHDHDGSAMCRLTPAGWTFIGKTASS